MRKLAFIATLAIVLASCCKKMYPTKIVEKEVVRTEYIEKIRIDTIEIRLPDESKEIVTKDTISRLVISSAISEAKVSGGFLFHTLANNPTYRPKVIVQVKETTIRDSVFVYKNKEIAVKMPRTKHESRMIGFGWAFIATIIVALGVVGFRIYRKFFLPLRG